MKKVLMILGLTVGVYFVAARLEPGIRVKFGIRGTRGVDNFFQVPITNEEATAAGWVLTPQPDGPLPELMMYCPLDKVFCMLVDDTGYIAGVQVAIQEDQFTENVFDWTKRGFTSWVTNVGGRPVRFWTIQAYFVSKETLMRRSKRIATRDSTRILQEGSVWFTGIDQKLLKVSTKEKSIRNSIFTTQACFDEMGNHYYYNMSATTECVAEQMYPWFVYMYRGEMVGMGFMTFGQLRVDSGRDWFERPGLPIIKSVVPYGPDCVYELAANPGVITMHIYVVEEPWKMSCQTQPQYQTKYNYY